MSFTSPQSCKLELFLCRFEMVPPLVKDRYWGLTKVQLPPVNAKKEALKPGDVVPAKYM